jgi:hypothetical protein
VSAVRRLDGSVPWRVGVFPDVYTVVGEYCRSMPDEVSRPRPPPPSSESPRPSIGDVGVFCAVCHRWNDGTSDFCTCRESLIGYRTLNTAQVTSWVREQARERDAAGAPTSTADIEALTSWAGWSDSSHGAAEGDVNIAMSCLLAFLWVVGLVFTFVGAWSYAAIDSGVGGESALVLVVTAPLGLLGIACLAAAVGLTISLFWRKRNGK